LDRPRRFARCGTAAFDAEIRHQAVPVTAGCRARPRPRGLLRGPGPRWLDSPLGLRFRALGGTKRFGQVGPGISVCCHERRSRGWKRLTVMRHQVCRRTMRQFSTGRVGWEKAIAGFFPPGLRYRIFGSACSPVRFHGRGGRVTMAIAISVGSCESCCRCRRRRTGGGRDSPGSAVTDGRGSRPR
jgi:hypothetical protein